MPLQPDAADLDTLVAERTEELSRVVARLQRELIERGQVEAALRGKARELAEATERYELVARMTSDAVYDWDLATNQLTFGPGMTTLFGHTQGAVPPSFEWWAEQVHPDDRERVVLSLEAAMSPGKGAFASEYRFRRGDGSYAFVFDRGTFLRDEGGKAIRMIGAQMDVSDRRRLEQGLVSADRMASVGTLAAGVAHEINNPLTYTITAQGDALETIESVLARPPAPEGVHDVLAQAAKALREAQSGAERVRKIVRDLKAFSRSDDDGQLQPVDVRAVLEAALALAWNEVRHRARLEKSFAAVPRVLANEARLGQVFLNLLMNAAQAIPAGSAARNLISLATRVDAGGRVVIEVKDTGAGISPEVRSKLFEPFFTTRAPGEGTGLGLAIARSVIEGMRGEIEVESEPGKGSTFRLILPVLQETVAERPSVLIPEPRRSDEPTGPRGRVLVVDDEPLVRTAVVRTLASQHEVSEAVSGLDALVRLNSGERFDAIVCDLMMPEMTGMELFDELQKVIPEQAGRIVFLSGGAFTPGAETFLRTTARPSLEKPFRAWEIRGAIASVIADHGLVARID